MKNQQAFKSLRNRTVSILALLLVGLMVLIYLVLNTIMLNSIMELENRYVQEHMKRFENTITSDLMVLSRIAEDWSAWGDAYEFIMDESEGFVSNNLQEPTFLNLDINVMLFINQAGEYVFAKGMDLENEQFTPISQALKEHLENSDILRNTDQDFKKEGLIMLPEGPMLIASHPILTSTYEGPVRGNVVVGRFLDDRVILNLSERLNFDIDTEDLTQIDLKKSGKFNQITPDLPISVQELSKNRIAAYSILKDIYEQPALGLSIEISREVSLVGRKGIQYVLFSLITAGFVFTIALLLFLDNNIFSRLLLLNKAVKSIGNKGVLSLRLKPEEVQDELTIVTEEINCMLNKLEESQHKIRESDEKYKTFVEKGKDIIYSIDYTGTITYISPNCKEVLGYDASEIIGKSFISFIFPDDQNGWKVFFERISVSNEYKNGYEYRVKLKNGVWRWFSTNASFLPKNSSHQGTYIGVFYDVHKRKLAEEALHQVNEDLEKRVEERTMELEKSYKALEKEIKERKKIQEEIHYLAYHDHLTGLSNRLLFTDRLNQAILLARRTEKVIGVIFLDLDAFKIANDTMGRDQGDELLKEVGKRLSDNLRKDDTISRIGGDEFLIIIQNLADTDAIVAVAEKIMDVFKKPFKLNQQEFYVTASIGISIYPTDGEDVEMLIKNADIAMYKAKENGKNQYVLCSPILKSKVMETMKLTNNLYRAQERNELVLYYQPQVSQNSGKIIGLEALIRWNHPELGFISPGKFIPIAEQAGLINSMGEWVLKTACYQNKAWQDAGLPPITMGVNLSVHQFQNPNIVNLVEKILKETALSPEYLDLEITESIAMKEINYIVEILKNLKDLGVKISIDDFGTEYSSLNYLKKLPIDKIKIAMQFVQGIAVSDKDKAIIKAILVLVRNLGLKVIAEGVETKLQLDFLGKEMCDEIQGYYYYKPMTAFEVEGILRAQGRG